MKEAQKDEEVSKSMKVSMSHLKDGLIWSMVIFFISAPICLWATGDIKIAVLQGSIYTAYHDPGNDWKFGF